MSLWTALLGSYLIGSLDFAVVVSRTQQVDGDGGGAHGASPSLGRGQASMVMLGNALKGLIAAAVGFLVAAREGAARPMGWALVAGPAAVIGHCFPVYHRFQGGKGVAIGGGVPLFVEPLVLLIVVVAWAVMARLSDVGAIAPLVSALLVVPPAMWQGLEGWPLIPLAGMLGLIVWRHLAEPEMVVGSERRTAT